MTGGPDDTWAGLLPYDAERVLNSSYVIKFPQSLCAGLGNSEKRKKRLRKLEGCGKTWAVYQCEDCGKQHKVPNSCGIRGCPTCSPFYGEDIRRKYEVLLRNYEGNVRKVELTWGPDVLSRDNLKYIFDLFCMVFDTFWKNYVVALEVSPHGSIHCHALVVGRYVPQSELSRRSAELTGRPIVYISRANCGRRAIRYALKDVVKGARFVNDKLATRYFMATEGMRLIRSKGLMYGKGKKEYSPLRCTCGGKLKWVLTITDAEYGFNSVPVYRRFDRPPD